MVKINSAKRPLRIPTRIVPFGFDLAGRAVWPASLGGSPSNRISLQLQWFLCLLGSVGQVRGTNDTTRWCMKHRRPRWFSSG